MWRGYRHIRMMWLNSEDGIGLRFQAMETALKINLNPCSRH